MPSGKVKLRGFKDVETSYGADFRAKCRELADRLGADFVSTVNECSSMAKFIDRAAFRITDAASDRLEKVNSNAVPIVPLPIG